MKKVYFIAGEVSGDKLGAGVMKSLKEHYNDKLLFYGIGGELMQENGLLSLFPIKEINLMGFFEVLPKIFKIKRLINKTVKNIKYIIPDIVITIDSPGFTFQVAKEIRASMPNLKIIHYVAPSVWAYKEKRALKYAKVYNHLFTLFPFEAPYFEKHGLETTCVGHPILNYDYDSLKKTSFRIKYNIAAEAHLICITPGSRKGEITKHMAILLEVIENLQKLYKDLVIAIPAASKEMAEVIGSLTENIQLKLIVVLSEEDKLNLYKAADLALAKSGTNTLEIAACGTAQIVFYKLNYISWLILRVLIKVRYASIINIIADKEIIPEFLQNNFSVKSILKEVCKYLNNKEIRLKQVNAAQNILKTIGLGETNTINDKAAQALIKVI